MANTFTLTSDSYNGRYLELVCTQTQDIANNKSTISWTLTSTGGSSNYYTTGATTVKIGSTTVYYKARVSWDDKVFPAAKGSTSGSIEVQHNSDGKLNLTVSLATAIHTAAVTTKSGTWTLDNNPRGATIVSAPNFNDEENPTITYTNHSGTNVTSIQACIANTIGNVIYVPYRDISKTGTSYTFALTDEERNTLRKATPNSNTMKVKFYIQTVIGTNTFRVNVEKTLTITNANPTLSPTLTDTDLKTPTLTGDASNKYVKYYSNAQCVSGAEAVKGASISSIKIECGTKSRTSDGLIGDVDSASFKFTVTDSRGNTATKTVNKTLISYVKLTCNLEMRNPSAEGKVDLVIKGNYFNGNFGATANTAIIKYRYKEDNSAVDWQDYITVTPTFSGNSYSANATVTGLDYTKRYVFQAVASDKLATVNSQEKKVKTLPVFDWGESDFNFNVPVKITDGSKVYNVLGLCKAMSTPYQLEATATAGSNYTVQDVSAWLMGNTLRCHFYVQRNSATETGNITNEKVLSYRIKHDGKIVSAISTAFGNGTTGGIAQFYIANLAYDDTYIVFDVELAATGGAYTQFGTYFTIPIALNLDKY